MPYEYREQATAPLAAETHLTIFGNRDNMYERETKR